MTGGTKATLLATKWPTNSQASVLKMTLVMMLHCMVPLLMPPGTCRRWQLLFGPTLRGMALDLSATRTGLKLLSWAWGLMTSMSGPMRRPCLCATPMILELMMLKKSMIRGAMGLLTLNAGRQRGVRAPSWPMKAPVETLPRPPAPK